MSAPSHMPRGRWPRLTFLAWTLLALVVAAAPRRAADPVTLLYFGADGCPFCAQMETFLDELEERFGDDLHVVRHEVSGDRESRDRWVRELAERGHEPSGVPTTILGGQVWIGFDARVGDQIESAVAAAIAERAQVERERAVEAPDTAETPVVEPVPEERDVEVAAPDRADTAAVDRAPTEPEVDVDEPDVADTAVVERAPTEAEADVDEPDAPETAIDVPFLGDVDVAAQSALAATALIAFIDGFNPCSLWVMAVLFGMILNAGATRGRVALIGGTFLMVTSLIYGAFIAGVFTVIGFIEHLEALRIGVACIALFVGAVNVKDHLAFRKGLSFTIPDRSKPRIYRGGRSIREAGRPLAAVLGTTMAMAAGISLVELPCTAGFPVIWSGILRTQGVEGTEFGVLLTLYLLIYILDELVLFGAVLVTLRIGRFQERHGRLLKLMGGAVMIALGVVLLAAPQLMGDLAGATLVIVGAVLAAIVFDRVHRRLTAGATR